MEPMTDKLTFRLESVEATRALGAKISGIARKGDTIALRGDLGAGKTSFAQGFLQARCPGVEVTSPTFTLIQTYGAEDDEIWHVDLYRINDLRELEELGLEEALGERLVLIEWPERMEETLPEDRLDVRLYHGQTAGRRAELCPWGSWCARIEKITT